MEFEKRIGKVYRYRWAIFITLLICYFFVYFHRMTVSVLGSDMIADVGGSVALLSSAYFYAYLMMQIPSGLLSDRFGPRSMTFLFLLLAAVGSVITFFAVSFSELVIGKIFIAVGLAVVYVPLMKLLAVWFKGADYAPLTGVVIAVGNVGAIAAAAPLAMLNDVIGWRDIFLLLGIVTLILSMLCLLIIRNHPHDKNLPSIEEIEYHETGKEPSESSEARIPTLTGLKMTIFGGRKFWMLALGYFLIYGTIMTYQGTWIKIYYESAFDFIYNAAWLVTMVGVGKILSSLMMGYVSQRVFHSKKKAVIIGNIGFLAIWGVIWLLTGKVDSYWFWMGVNFMFGFFGGFMTVSFSQVKELFPIAISGTVIATMNTFLFAGAAVMTNLSHFIIVNRTPAEFETLWMLMFFFIALACILSCLSVEKDPEKC